MGIRFVFDERFLEAFLTAREYRVLGLRLQPYSSWHELNLQAVNSPLLTGAPLTVPDLVCAARVCASRFRPGGLRPVIEGRNWRERWLMKWRLCRCDFGREVEELRTYLADFHSTPKFWKNSHKDKDGAAADDRDAEFDEILAAVGMLCHETGWSEEYVWNLPLGVLRWYAAMFFKWRSQSRDRLIWTPRDEELYQKHLREKEADIAATAQRFAQEEKLAPAEARKKAEADYARRAAEGMKRLMGGGAGGPPSGVRVVQKPKRPRPPR